MGKEMIRSLLEELMLIMLSSTFIFMYLFNTFLHASSYTIINEDRVQYLPKGSIVMSHDQECNTYINDILKFEDHANSIENDIERAYYYQSIANEINKKLEKLDSKYLDFSDKYKRYIFYLEKKLDLKHYNFIDSRPHDIPFYKKIDVAPLVLKENVQYKHAVVLKGRYIRLYSYYSKLIENYDTCRVMTFGAVVALVDKDLTAAELVASKILNPFLPPSTFSVGQDDASQPLSGSYRLLVLTDKNGDPNLPTVGEVIGPLSQPLPLGTEGVKYSVDRPFQVFPPELLAVETDSPDMSIRGTITVAPELQSELGLEDRLVIMLFDPQQGRPVAIKILPSFRPPQNFSIGQTNAIKEITHYKEYSYVLINQNVMQTVNDILDIIKYRLIIEKNKKLTDRKLKFLINF